MRHGPASEDGSRRRECTGHVWTLHHFWLCGLLSILYAFVQNPRLKSYFSWSYLWECYLCENHLHYNTFRVITFKRTLRSRKGAPEKGFRAVVSNPTTQFQVFSKITLPTGSYSAWSGRAIIALVQKPGWGGLTAAYPTKLRGLGMR